MHEKNKSMLLAKTLKIVILRRENAYFQEIEDRKNIKIEQKSMKNRMFFWTSILEGLDWVGLDWVGLGWVGLGWVGLGWVGLGWIGLG